MGRPSMEEKKVKVIRQKLKQGKGEDIELNDKQLLEHAGHFARLSLDELEETSATEVVATIRNHIEHLYRSRT